MRVVVTHGCSDVTGNLPMKLTNVTMRAEEWDCANKKWCTIGIYCVFFAEMLDL